MLAKLNVGVLPRVDSAFPKSKSLIITNMKKHNPLDNSDFTQFKLKEDGLHYTTIGRYKGIMMTRSFASDKKITDKESIKKVLNFFKNQDFDLINISEAQRVTKENFQKTKEAFVEGLENLLQPKPKKVIKKTIGKQMKNAS